MYLFRLGWKKFVHVLMASSQKCFTSTREQKGASSQRWKMLKKAILSDKSGLFHLSSAQLSVSARSFASFELFHIKDVEREEEDISGSSWNSYTFLDSLNCGVRLPQVCVLVKCLPLEFSLGALSGFNNTGNVCIWPSEEVMAYYCLSQRDKFKNKTVCELGAGMTGLAGLMLALTGMPSHVLLTDGNQASVNNLCDLIKINGKKVNISAEVLVWSEDFLDSEYPVFDYVICADCLFFTDIHSCLYRVICKLLSPGGECLMFSPRRGCTMQQFSQLVAADGKMEVEERERYDGDVWKRHQILCEEQHSINYRPDIHYPVLLKLKHHKLQGNNPLKLVSGLS